MLDRTNVIRFPEPTRHRVDRAAIEAVRLLAGAQLVSESEAVAALKDLGAHSDEIDLLRNVYAVRRGRV